MPYASDDERWTAVVARDPRADGAFFYSVASTGVYCRPGCPSRLARRENVRFHATAEDAERAGFRACKRCRPQGGNAESGHARAIAKACETLARADEPPSLEALAQAAGLSPFHFHRVFRKTTGLTPRAYAAARRAGRVREELLRRDTVTEAMYSAGFNSSGRFYAESGAMLGMTPRAFRARGAGETIRYAVAPCALGRVLVAASERGVCAIALGDDADALVGELRERYAAATFLGEDKQLREWVRAIVSYIETPAAGLDLPLDVRGTAFQHRVWQALVKIPRGSTASYGEIAKSIGANKAVRAVAGACAANPLAVAIPCHRAVRQTGALSGYRWGVERKRELLERESRGARLRLGARRSRT